MAEMELDPGVLPTHLSKAVARLRVVGPDASGDTFLLTSYLFEAALKTIAICLWSGIRDSSPEQFYAIGYRLVRADGIGEWDDVIQQLATQPLAGYLPPFFQPTLNWITQKRKPDSDEWFASAIGAADQVISTLGLEPDAKSGRPRTVRHLLTSLVLIRNKTKAHGAVGPDFFAAANSHYVAAVSAVLMRCPLFRDRWLHLSVRVGKNKVRGVKLQGTEPTFIRDQECESYSPNRPGIYVELGKGQHPTHVGDLLRTTLECRQFLLPNGGFSGAQVSEFIDYGTGETSRVDQSTYSLPPAPLPPSETEGLDELDVQSNVFGNLPKRRQGYVERPRLQESLRTRLLDQNHPIITLHGRGGIGKTSLALWAAHELAGAQECPFGSIVWFSARDVDLRHSGPASVRASVVDLKSVAKKYGTMFSSGQTEDTFAEMLRTSDADGKGKLLVFDNFETFADARQLHKFLDTHTHLPNKVLMTSRERAFKADYPIEVHGMEVDEARRLMSTIGRELGVEGMLSDAAMDSIHRHTDGHPYVMRLVIGEVAKEGRYVPPKDLLPRRFDIVNAVFERSFNKLSQNGRWSFLLVSNWRVPVSELALVVTCAEAGIDAEEGAEECVRLSLLSSEQAPDGSYFYWAPELARVFGRKKLDSDQDRLTILEALTTLRRFSFVKIGQVGTTTQSQVVNRFLASALQTTSSQDRAGVEHLSGLLERIADLYAPAWEQVASFRRQYRLPREQIELSLRRWVEERPGEKKAWLARADYAREVGDDLTWVSCLVSAVDADPVDLELLGHAAYSLCSFIDAHRIEIPRARRGVFLAGVRSHMEKSADKLDATALSRLAWLFLLENDTKNALKFAKRGLETEPSNEHCRRIVQRLESDGRRLPWT